MLLEIKEETHVSQDHIQVCYLKHNLSADTIPSGFFMFYPTAITRFFLFLFFLIHMITESQDQVILICEVVTLKEFHLCSTEKIYARLMIFFFFLILTFGQILGKHLLICVKRMKNWSHIAKVLQIIFT